MGLLEVFAAPASGWASLESQAGMGRVLPTQAQSTTAHEEALADAAEADTGRADASQCPVVDGLHGRHVAWRSALSDLQCVGLGSA